MDVIFLMSSFRLYPGLKMSFEHNSVHKKLFLSACFCWDCRLSSREMDQKYKFGGIIGNEDSYLVFLFRHFEKFRLHALLHDAARGVWARNGKVPVHNWARPNLIVARSRDWINLLPLRKTLSALHFKLCRLLKQYVLHCTRY